MLKEIKDKLFGRSNDESGAPRVTAQRIVMYSTRFCPYCMRARSLLQSKGWEYQDIAIDGNPALRSEMIQRSDRHTVPQIWIGDRHIGGCDELFQLEVSHKLEAIVMGGNQ